jgi:hypothetical protein
MQKVHYQEVERPSFQPTSGTDDIGQTLEILEQECEEGFHRQSK